MVKRVLMVAYHFPPMNASSGIQRTLRFAQYLPKSGWEPAVLTVRPQAYSATSAASLAEVPPELNVCRVFALDGARHFALRGRYPQFLCIPDRWWSWWLSAVPAGLALVRKFKPDVLWTTYPIASAHLIGSTLHRLTGIPWVADFRDPMAQEAYPPSSLERSAFKWIEYRTLKHCAQAVFTAPGALRLYAERYPDIPRSRLTIIENGYDEWAFKAAEQTVCKADTSRNPPVLLHSGTIYASERDPRPFFAALASLQRSGDIAPGALKVIMRATGCDDYVRRLIAENGLDGIVFIEPALPYREALAEMLSVDALLVLQAANCNYQVPAKVYEYLRAKRPVMALTDPAGDTAAVLRDAGIDTIAPIDSQEDIGRLLVRFLDLLRHQQAPVAQQAKIAASSREVRTAQLARMLDTVAS